MMRKWKKQENFQIIDHILTIEQTKIENYKEKTTRQLKFHPYQVLTKKRTKDKKCQTGPWLPFDGPYFTDVRHTGKVSVFLDNRWYLLSSYLLN